MKNDIEQMTETEFRKALKDNFKSLGEAKFICPRCKTIQTPNDLIKAGAGKDLDDVQGYIAFSCVGRWDKDKGCDWTLGGMFQIHELEVILDAGGKRPCFKIKLPHKAVKTPNKNEGPKEEQED